MPTDPFLKPASNVKALHDNIVDALAELRGAREIAAHSPGNDAQRGIDLAEWRLDVLLARQWATMQAEVQAEQMVDAG